MKKMVRLPSVYIICVVLFSCFLTSCTLQACVLYDVCTLGTMHRYWGLVCVRAPFLECLFGKFPCTPLRKGIRVVQSLVLLEAFKHHQAVATFIQKQRSQASSPHSWGRGAGVQAAWAPVPRYASFPPNTPALHSPTEVLLLPRLFLACGFLMNFEVF